MPFPRNFDFVGRSGDLDRLHAVLQRREPVGIRPAGLTGMGGIGKTQLAVEYVYRHKDDYPGGVFWVNAAEPLIHGLAQVGVELRPEAAGQSSDHQLKSALKDLKQRPDALLVFDNLEDPAHLSRPLNSEASPLTLGCPILFTTRQRDLGRYHTVELAVLPEEPALQLLLRHDSRRPVLEDPRHPERTEAKSICLLLGRLPLALELAGAFLAEWPDMPLADYRKRLEKKGCLSTLDSEVANLSQVNFQPIHGAAVAATLQTQWESLRPNEEAARIVFRIAGQFSEATVIPTTMLGLFAGLPDVGEPGDPSPLRRVLKRLHAVRLVEELLASHVRLHPLVREFAAMLTPLSKTPGFRHECARRVVTAFEDFATLEDATRINGVDGLQQTLMTALDFIPGGKDEPARVLHAMLRVFRREAHLIRGWDPGRQPNYFAQQVLCRARSLGEMILAMRAERRLNQLNRPALVVRWRTLRESPALVRILGGHGGMVYSVAVSPDERHVVTGAGDGTAAVWDLHTGRRLRVLEGHVGAVTSLAISPDGRYVLTGSEDRTTAVWDLDTGEQLRVLDGHRGAVYSVAVSPDGRHTVSGSSDGTAAVWDLDTGEQLRVLVVHRGRVNSVAICPDGRHVVTGSEDRTAAVWDFDTGEQLRVLDGHAGVVTSVAVSWDGRQVVTGSRDGTAAVWGLNTGERLRVLDGHRGRVTSVAISPDGRYVLTGAGDGTATVWDLDTGEQLRVLRGHRGAVYSVAVSPDSRLVVTGSYEGAAAVWDLNIGERPHVLDGHRGRVSSVAISPDGRHAVSGSSDGTAAVWDLDTGEQLRTLDGHRGRVTSVAISPDGRHVVTGSKDRTAAVWGLDTGEQLRVLDGHREAVYSVAVSPDSRLAVTGSGDRTAAVWDLNTGKRLRNLVGHRREVNSVAVSLNGRYAVTGSGDQSVGVWDLQAGLILSRVSLDGPVRCVAWAPDSRSLIAGDSGGTIYHIEYRES